ncbi:MAG: GDPmannose 4 6-dehydratase [Candidatus Saganbacteria bacterium]|uniref:GDPmannose 4 6-dehydratase n=1 Tax=Candidatus Saganbacteria bacterium TaxID=2575572 RepID=A0A833NXQ8_UNCSA|nr:MAG: GDPmannose 4 6-dehydratase [Candidatus Saganbacteria bacterium]
MSGSGGSYLAEYVVNHHPEIEVHGISRWHSTAANENLRNIRDNVTVHECDLNDLSSVLSTLKQVKPDGIFHLASHANVRASFITPLSVLNNNIMGTANLLEGIRIAELDPVVQLCSTSEVYGQVDPKNVPIKEDCPINPSSPYAVSKVAQDLLGYTYYLSYKMKIIRTRMFAYLNPRRQDLFATSFTMQVARIEAGQQKILLHGNLDSIRTIIDVRDAMESYWVALLKCRYGEVYNIGGPTTIKVGEFMELLKKLARVPIKSEVDPKLLRPADVTLQVPDVSKFKKETGWQPKYSFEESVQYLLDHCREAVARETV